MDSGISESCYKGIILQRNYRKTTILWSFSYYSFVKFHDHVISKSVLFLFDSILYIPSTIFQLCRDGSSWVEPVLS